MNSFNECLKQYGADVNGINDRFMGNETIYLKVLRMLFEDQNMNQLEQTLKANDLKGAYERSHTLKGVSSNLGLTPLYKAVCEIVEPLRHQQSEVDYISLFENIKKEFNTVRTLYQSLLELN